VILSEIYHFH